MADYSAARLDLSMLLPGATNALLKLFINVKSPCKRQTLICIPLDCWASLAALDPVYHTVRLRRCLVTKTSSQTCLASHLICHCYSFPAFRNLPFVVAAGSFPGSSQGSSLVVVLVLGPVSFVTSCCSWRRPIISALIDPVLNPRCPHWSWAVRRANSGMTHPSDSAAAVRPHILVVAALFASHHRLVVLEIHQFSLVASFD